MYKTRSCDGWAKCASPSSHGNLIEVRIYVNVIVHDVPGLCNRVVEENFHSSTDFVSTDFVYPLRKVSLRTAAFKVGHLQHLELHALDVQTHKNSIRRVGPSFRVITLLIGSHLSLSYAFPVLKPTKHRTTLSERPCHEFKNTGHCSSDETKCTSCEELQSAMLCKCTNFITPLHSANAVFERRPRRDVIETTRFVKNAI